MFTIQFFYRVMQMFCYLYDIDNNASVLSVVGFENNIGHEWLLIFVLAKI